MRWPSRNIANLGYQPLADFTRSASPRRCRLWWWPAATSRPRRSPTCDRRCAPSPRVCQRPYRRRVTDPNLLHAAAWHDGHPRGVRVAYRGGSQAMSDLVGGPRGFQLHIAERRNLPDQCREPESPRGRDARARRHYPAVPTAAESGLPGFEGLHLGTGSSPRAACRRHPRPAVGRHGCRTVRSRRAGAAARARLRPARAGRPNAAARSLAVSSHGRSRDGRPS